LANIYSDIRQEIIDTLKASSDPDLRTPTPIAEYHYGLPTIEPRRFPYIAVGLVGGRWRASVELEWIIECGDRSSIPDQAEKNVEDYAERIRKVIERTVWTKCQRIYIDNFEWARFQAERGTSIYAGCALHAWSISSR